MISLSIIVPVYNVEKYVRACVESLFRQGLTEDIFEVIIVNDDTSQIFTFFLLLLLNCLTVYV